MLYSIWNLKSKKDCQRRLQFNNFHKTHEHHASNRNSIPVQPLVPSTMAQNTNQSSRHAFDVCFRVGDGLYYGRKALLIKASLYFKTMFACNFKEAHQDTNLVPIEMPNVEPKYLEIMLKYNESNRLLGISSVEEAEALYGKLIKIRFDFQLRVASCFM
jgi:hypothetical protein